MTEKTKLVQDNSLKVGLNMEQRSPEGDLSNTVLNVDYPSINRDAANIAQFDLVLAQVKSVVSMTVASPRVQEAPEMLAGYIGWLRIQAQDFDALANRLAAPTGRTK